MKFHLNDYIIEIDVASYRDRDRELRCKAPTGVKGATLRFAHDLLVPPTEERRKLKL